MNVSSEKPRVLIQTLGCKVNQYDSERMRSLLLRRGCVTHREGDAGDPDLIVVNTCSVTAESERKSRQAIRKLIRKHPSARVIVSGCYSERKPDDILGIAGVDGVIPIERQEELLRRLADDLGWGCEDQDSLWSPTEGIDVFEEHTRAFVKIQDGCDLKCTFCSIPASRGAARSRPVAEVTEEARKLAAAGYPEIVLCGVCIGHYGRGMGFGLPDLLRELVRIEGVRRIRISSMEPQDVSDELYGVMADWRSIICPHLHLPLQSGSNKILRRMKRPYTREFFMERVGTARRMLPDFEISTDIMVGFPDESDDDFEDTLDIVREARFNKVHSFPFSVREEAPAARMKNHLPREIIRKRRIELDRAANATADGVRQSYVGKIMPVLAEVSDDAHSTGFTPNYLRVDFKSPQPIRKGDIHDIKMESASNGRLIGIGGIGG